MRHGIWRHAVLDGGPQADSARPALGSPVALALESGCNTARDAAQSLAAARKMAGRSARSVALSSEAAPFCASAAWHVMPCDDWMLPKGQLTLGA